MSSEFVTLGPNAAVLINNQAWASIEGNWREPADTPEVSDTGTKRKKFRDGGMTNLELDVTAHRATNVSPHIAPFILRSGEYIDLKFYPHGILFEPYHCPTFLLREVGGGYRVMNSEPTTFRFAGVSSGNYTVPEDGS